MLCWSLLRIETTNALRLNLRLVRWSGVSVRADIRASMLRKAGMGRFLPVATPLSDRQLLVESGHWNFDAKSHIYEFVSGCLGSFPDIRERLLTATSGSSDKRVFWELPTDHLMRDQGGSCDCSRGVASNMRLDGSSHERTEDWRQTHEANRDTAKCSPPRNITLTRRRSSPAETSGSRRACGREHRLSRPRMTGGELLI